MIRHRIVGIIGVATPFDFLLLFVALTVASFAPVSSARAVPLIDSTDNFDVIITRFGLVCPDEPERAEQPDANKPRSTLDYAGKPCRAIKYLAEKMSKMSAREPLQNYLERNDFQCAKHHTSTICYRELVYVFSPILYGRRLNPDIRNRFITFAEFSQKNGQYLSEKDIKINFIRFVHQDKPNDPAELLGSIK